MWLSFEKITNSFEGNDFEGGVVAEVVAEAGDIDIEVARIKEGIVAPNTQKNITTLYGEVEIFGQNRKQFGFAVGEFPNVSCLVEFVAVR